MCIGGWVVGSVAYLGRAVASPAVIAKLVDLGYLQNAKRHRASAIENAIERLRSDPRDGVIWEGDLSRRTDAVGPNDQTAQSVPPSVDQTHFLAATDQCYNRSGHCATGGLRLGRLSPTHRQNTGRVPCFTWSILFLGQLSGLQGTHPLSLFPARAVSGRPRQGRLGASV